MQNLVVELVNNVVVEGWKLNGEVYLVGKIVDEIIGNTNKGIRRYWAAKDSDLHRKEGYRTSLIVNPDGKSYQILYPIEVAVEYWRREARKGNKQAFEFISQFKEEQVKHKLIKTTY